MFTLRPMRTGDLKAVGRAMSEPNRHESRLFGFTSNADAVRGLKDRDPAVAYTIRKGSTPVAVIGLVDGGDVLRTFFLMTDAAREHPKALCLAMRDALRREQHRGPIEIVSAPPDEAVATKWFRLFGFEKVEAAPPYYRYRLKAV